MRYVILKRAKANQSWQVAKRLPFITKDPERWSAMLPDLHVFTGYEKFRLVNVGEEVSD